MIKNEVVGAWCPDFAGGEFFAFRKEGEDGDLFQARIARAWEIDALFNELEAACLQIAKELCIAAPGRGEGAIKFALSLQDYWGVYSHLPAILQDLGEI